MIPTPGIHGAVDGGAVLAGQPGRAAKRRGRAGAARSLGLGAALAGAVAASCTDPTLRRRCSSDDDCPDPATWRCDERTGYCLCRSGTACRTGQVCNASGYCVPQNRCSINTECVEGQVCDTTTGTCVPPGRCGTDLACQSGEVCDRNTSTCRGGCRSSGDCALGEVCVCAAPDGGDQPCLCPASGEIARQACPQVPGDGGLVAVAPGKCLADRCGDTTYCSYGEVCQPPPDGGLPTCQTDYDFRYRPYCDPCGLQPGGNTCGSGPNYCLTAFDPNTNRQYEFCGADCSAGQPCPNGYSCEDVIVVYGRWKCASDRDCAAPERRSSLLCQKDSDCPNQGLCHKDPGATTGNCYGSCGIAEGTTSGFCSCIVDDDCFQDSCDPISGACSVSRKPCAVGGGGCTSRVRCVDFGSGGGCLIGQNCAPLEGLTCSDVKR